MANIDLYVHLIPQTTELISETLKLSISESSLINELRLSILAHLEKQNVNFNI